MGHLHLLVLCFRTETQTQRINSTATILITLDSPSKCQLYAPTSTRWQTQVGICLLSPILCTQGAFDKPRYSPLPAQAFLAKWPRRVRRLPSHRTVAHHWIIQWLSEHVQPPKWRDSKTIEVSQVPVRCVRFIPQELVRGSDFQLRSFNDNTHDKVVAFYVHPDYIRCLTVHPAHPVFTGTDDMTINPGTGTRAGNAPT